MTAGQFPQMPLVDRDAEQAAIARMAASVEASRQKPLECTPHVLYFRARGGLGKTRLLKESVPLIKGQQPHMLVSVIVDMYDYDNRSPLEIERKIADGLKDDAKRVGLTAQQVEQFFFEYDNAFDYFYKVRSFSHEVASKAEHDIHDAFVKCCNNISIEHPLVFRFDTFEVIESKAPSYSFALDREKPILLKDAHEDEKTNKLNESLLDWFAEIFQKLRCVLIIISGRPTDKKEEQELLQLIRKDGIVSEEIEILPIKNTEKILEYLRQYGCLISVDKVSYVRQITQGLPLLLTLYARTREDGNLIESQINSRGDFEDNLIEQTFNLLGNMPPRTGTDSAKERQVFIFCLFVLSCARRGIRRKDLESIFKQFGLESLDNVIQLLEKETFIRTTPGWYQKRENSDTEKLQLDNTLFFLHDEILVLIDQSEKLDELEYRQPILAILCDQSKEQVRDHALDLAFDRPRLEILTDHMYYELTRDIAIGYQCYTIYADWLLRQRYSQNALILAEVFWNTIHYSTHRGLQEYKPYYYRLLQNRKVSLHIINEDEELRYIKRLRFTDKDQEVLDYAKLLYVALSEKHFGKSAVVDDYFARLQNVNPYLYADLCVTVAGSEVRLGKDLHRTDKLLTNVIDWLTASYSSDSSEKPDDFRVSQYMVYLRAQFFLGEAYNLRGQIKRNQQNFFEAIKDFTSSQRAYEIYHTRPVQLFNDQKQFEVAATYLGDKVAADVAQVENNLAYALADDGKLQEAISLSETIIQNYIVNKTVVAAHQQARFYNTNALIRMRMEEIAKVDAPLRKAEAAAEQAGLDREIGLVGHARALYQRAELSQLFTKYRWRPDLSHFEIKEEIQSGWKNQIDDCETNFAKAEDKLRLSPQALGEVYLNRARFKRDLHLFYQYNPNESARADKAWKESQDYLQKATKILPGQTLLLATAEELEACLYIQRFGDKERKQADDDKKAASILQQAEHRILEGDGFPRYAHVVAGKIELQRGLLLFFQGQHMQALRAWAIAYAHAHHFNANHRDLRAFDKLIREWWPQIPFEIRKTYVELMLSESIVKRDDITYKPDSLESGPWLESWGASKNFFASLLEN